MARHYTPEFREDAIRCFESHTELDNRHKAKNLGMEYLRWCNTLCNIRSTED